MVKVSPYIYVNLTSASCCLFFLLFLLLTYFSKKNMNNIDNKIYKHMLIFNLLSAVFYVLFYSFDLIAVFSPDYNDYYALVYFFSKLAPLMMIYWAMFFCFYIHAVTNEKDKKFINNIRLNSKKYFKILYLVMVIIGIVHFCEYSKINLATGMEYSLLIVMNVSLYFCLLLSITNIIKHRKNLEKKKLLPMFAIIPIVIVAALLGISSVCIVVLLIMITAINHLMYHTIENPDMKLINELELAKNQAEKASQAKSDFLSSMSHELRTPINAISGLSQMISVNDNIEEMHQDSKDIIIASQKLLELVESVLDINKIEANQIELIEDNYNPLSIFNSLSSKINMRIGEKPIEFKTDFSNTIPSNLFGDSEKVRIILTNLLTNAIKYTEKGTVLFKVNSNIVGETCNLVFIISDTGRGIKEDQMDLLFTKFYRLDEDKDSDIEGTGLGLAITKSLVELMDGKISVNSVYGEGTTFTVNISQKLKGIKRLNEDINVSDVEIL